MFKKIVALQQNRKLVGQTPVTGKLITIMSIVLKHITHSKYTYRADWRTYFHTSYLSEQNN